MAARKLASLQRISRVEKVKNSDSLSLATVLGWSVVIRTEDFSAGDLVIYFEVDSILPPLSDFDFLQDQSYRLSTRRLRGQLSQGLVWFTSILPEGTPLEEGLDVTDLLGVTKYERVIPADMLGRSAGHHPTSVSKAGELRVQSAPQLLEEFQGLDVYVTTKIEGETASYIYDNGKYDVCSHTHSLLESDRSIHWQMEKKYGIRQILEGYGGIGLQGEIAGPGIFGNPLALPDKQLFVFRITELATQKRLEPEEMKAFCQQHGLQVVPMDFLPAFNLDVAGVLSLAEGTYPCGNPREGIVILPAKRTYSEYLRDWLSMKVINNTYLLGHWKKNRK